MIKLEFYLVMLLLGLLTSCDQENFIDYYIKNNTNDNLEIDYTYSESFVWDGIIPNTVTQILPNQNLKLFTFTLWSPSVYDKENNNQMEFIRNVEVFKLSDSSYMTKDAALRRNWNYTETGKNSADYTFYITDNDFN